MASFTVEKVIEEVLNSDNEDEDQEECDEVEDREEESLYTAIESILDSFPAKEGFNRELFKDVGKEVLKDVLLPIVAQCSVDCTSYSELQSNERSKAAKVLSTTTLNAGSILRTESLLWLKRVNTRLGGRVAFRRPYHGNISRSIPYDVFKVARRVVSENRDGSFLEPKCYLKKNNKAEIICFTSMYSVQKFLSVISALSIKEVKKYFTRKLKSRGREDHIVKLLVDEERQLALTYWIRRGQMDISFQYGEWNTANYPFHNCKYDPFSYLGPNPDKIS